MAAPAGRGRTTGLRNRRIAIAFGLGALVHLAVLSVFVLSTTRPVIVAPRWDSSFRVTLVRNPLAAKRVTAPPAPKRPALAPRTPPKSVTVATTTSVASPAPPAVAATPPTAASGSSGDDTSARMRGALHGLAACHSYGITPTEKEKRACEERLGRVADNAPAIDAPPPVAQSDPALKLGTCRLNLRRLLSARVKCRF